MMKLISAVFCFLFLRRGRSTTRRGGRPAAAAAAARATEPEVELEDYTNRELTNAPPPSYNIALATTSPIDTEVSLS